MTPSWVIRLRAFADAAESICYPCFDNNKKFINPVQRAYWSAAWKEWKHHYVWILTSKCDASGIRTIVEQEHQGMGSKSPAEWRAFADKEK